MKVKTTQKLEKLIKNLSIHSQMSSFAIEANHSLLNEIKIVLENYEDKELSLAGVDFFVEQVLRTKGKKIKCMLCLKFVGSTGVIKHLSSPFHRSNYLETCFPSTFKHLIELQEKSLDDVDLQIISKSLINSLASKICAEIVKLYADKFIPWTANNLRDKEFNSIALVTHIHKKINHVNEADFPETKDLIDSTIEQFMKKSSEFRKISGFGSKKEMQTDVGEQEVPRKRLKRSFQPHVNSVESMEVDKPSLSETEMDRMKVAINIALEVFSKGLSISPAQLEESVSAFYKHDFAKSINHENIQLLETLTRDEILLLMDNFDELLESEQNDFAKYLNMLRRIDHKIIHELRADKERSENLIKIISYA